MFMSNCHKQLHGEVILICCSASFLECPSYAEKGVALLECERYGVTWDPHHWQTETGEPRFEFRGQFENTLPATSMCTPAVNLPTLFCLNHKTVKEDQRIPPIHATFSVVLGNAWFQFSGVFFHAHCDNIP